MPPPSSMPMSRTSPLDRSACNSTGRETWPGAVTGTPSDEEDTTITAYEETIRKLDPTINAVDVEASMRLRYGTLDHLPTETFREEIEIAQACEKVEPGFLRSVADSYGDLADFERAEKLVQEPKRIVVPGTPKLVQPLGIVTP